MSGRTAVRALKQRALLDQVLDFAKSGEQSRVRRVTKQVVTNRHHRSVFCVERCCDLIAQSLEARTGLKRSTRNREEQTQRAEPQVNPLSFGVKQTRVRETPVLSGTKSSNDLKFKHQSSPQQGSSARTAHASKPGPRTPSAQPECVTHRIERDVEESRPFPATHREQRANPGAKAQRTRRALFHVLRARTVHPFDATNAPRRPSGWPKAVSNAASTPIRTAPRGTRAPETPVNLHERTRIDADEQLDIAEQRAQAHARS